MDFRELTYITAVADNHSVTEAARKLFISQPSLSYIISKVEEDLGVKLFNRKTNPITLTYAGERYVKTARQILVMRENLRRELSDIGHGMRGRINIGIPTERAGYMLPKVIGPFREKYPNVEIHLQESRSKDIINNLINDNIAFCVLPGSEEDLPAGLKTEYIYTEKLYLVAGKGMITERMKRQNGTVNLQKCAELPFILMKRGQYIRKKTDGVFRTYSFIPKEVMEVSSCISAVELASAGLGITIVPERAIIALRGSHDFECFNYSSGEDSWPVNVVYKADVYLDQSERTLIETMKEVFAKKALDNTEDIR